MARCGFEITKRIVWRLQEDSKGSPNIKLSQIRRAIFVEAGTQQRTVNRHIKILEELKILKRHTRYIYDFNPEAVHIG